MLRSVTVRVMSARRAQAGVPLAGWRPPRPAGRASLQLYHTNSMIRQKDGDNSHRYTTQQQQTTQQSASHTAASPHINVRQVESARAGCSAPPATIVENTADRRSIDYVTNDEIDEWIYRDRMTPERARAEQLPPDGRQPLHLQPHFQYMQYGIYMFWIVLYTALWYISFQLNLKNLTSTDVHTFIRMHADDILRGELTAKDVNPPTTGKSIAGLVIPDECVRLDYKGDWKPAADKLIQQSEQDIAAGKPVIKP